MKPGALRALHGTGHRPIPVEPPSRAGPISPPRYLSAAQRRIFREALASAPRGVLRRIDRNLLASWSVAVDLLGQAVIEQNKLARLIVLAPKTRTPMPSPLANQIAKWTLVMLRAAEQLGFSPTARPRLGLGAIPLPPVPMPLDDAGGIERDDSISLDEFLAQRPGGPLQ